MGNCCEALILLLDSKRNDYQSIPESVSNGQLHQRSSSEPQHVSSSSKTLNDSVRRSLPPEFFKQYEIEGQLGIGTTSKVYTVRKTKRRKTDEPIREMACKVIDKRKLTLGMERRDVEPLLSQLRKEVDILRRINHPNIVQYIDFMESRDKIIIITEKLPGGELFDYIINNGPLTESRAREILYGVFSAVAYLHDRGVIHRDIKAENLIFFEQLNGKQSLKMIDFGFSTILKHSLTGSFLGTGGYIAPEIRQNKNYSTSVDNWALGVLLYCALSAKLPFPVSIDVLPTDKDECRKAFQLRWPPKIWANISEDCKDLITRLLEVDPFKRLTAKEALHHSWFRSVEQKTISIKKRVVASISGTIRSSSFANAQIQGLSLKREKRAAVGKTTVAVEDRESDDEDDFHNPYWELPELHQSSLRRSMSTFQVERRSHATPLILTTLSTHSTEDAKSKEAPNGGFLLGYDRDCGSDTSLTSAEATSGYGRQSIPRQTSASFMVTPPVRHRTESFGFGEMHDRLAGDLFYSTYFPPH